MLVVNSEDRLLRLSSNFAIAVLPCATLVGKSEDRLAPLSSVFAIVVSVGEPFQVFVGVDGRFMVCFPH